MSSTSMTAKAVDALAYNRDIYSNGENILKTSAKRTAKRKLQYIIPTLYIINVG